MAWAVSEVINRNIPYSEVSATVAAIIRILALPKMSRISLSRPDLFSRKTESCCMILSFVLFIFCVNLLLAQLYHLTAEDFLYRLILL